MTPTEQLDTMTDEMDAQLAAEAQAERVAEKEASKKKPEWERAAEEDHPELAEKEEPKAKEEEKKEEVKEEPKEEVKEEAETPKEEIKPDVTAEQDKVIQEWATKHNLSIEEAKEDFAKTKAIVEKFKTPEEMARSLRQIQSERDKLKNETSKPSQPTVPMAAVKDPREEINKAVAKNAEKLLEDYRHRFPAKSEALPEEAILEEIADGFHQQFVYMQQQQRTQMKQKAIERREQILVTLPESDKQFASMLKPVLNEMSDDQILDPEFNLGELINWAYGKNRVKLLAEAEERGYKRAKAEGSKILGQLPQSSGGNKNLKAKPASSSSSLGSYDKDRALEMYEGTTMTEDEKFQAYAELKKSKEKKNESKDKN